ncbi:LPS assembly lipoprotein LptE [Gallaecimonas pentaromativorans]|uniref:LPS-assembly lipoprotein LptE n=1 Tax=Gallaecimonas pentaromativorans TaxID=584787 RepID=A0A3N1PBH2_9GAMM|nr:LPS assembly lipoprotein LptE [Gallaecimonas pentaromativorans]MED5525186.1 LPS assembly lipoprotein LptE [Pseudomonadota bacterium]ROQ25975.1 LPS-assembly lipoprotein [Gallaecimonas pentaromativorans]
MRWLVFATLLLLGGCGFHLQGSYEMPSSFKTVNLTSFDPYASITKAVTKSLTASGVNLIGGNGPEIHLVADHLDRQTLSLFSTGQVAEYELVYTLTWQIIEKDKDPRDLTIEVRRDYQDDPTKILAKDKERELLVDEMRKEAADRLVRQLAQG